MIAGNLNLGCVVRPCFKMYKVCQRTLKCRKLSFHVLYAGMSLEKRAHEGSLTPHAITLSDVTGMYRMSGLSLKVVRPTTLKNPSTLIHLLDPSIIINIIYVGSILKIRKREVLMQQMNSCQGLQPVWLHRSMQFNNDLDVQFTGCSQTEFGALSISGLLTQAKKKTLIYTKFQVVFHYSIYNRHNLVFIGQSPLIFLCLKFQHIEIEIIQSKQKSTFLNIVGTPMWMLFSINHELWQPRGVIPWRGEQLGDSCNG